MSKKVFSFLIIMLISFSYYGSAQELFEEKMLSIIDDSGHVSQEFVSVITNIRKYYPQYTKAEIADTIKMIYYTLRTRGVQISIYEVAEDIRRFVATDFDLGIDAGTLIQAYVSSRSR